MIITGDPIQADDALATGLVERIVDADSLDGALAFAQEVAARESHPKLRDRTVALPPGADAAALFAAARAQVATQARGLPAPLKCIDAVEAAVTLPFDEGLAFERGALLELVQSPESKALRHAFFAERAAAKIPDVPEDTPTRAIRTAAIIGAGTMGGGIAMNFANAGIPVTVLEKEQDALDRGLATLRRNYGSDREEGPHDAGGGRPAHGAAAADARLRPRCATPTSSSRPCSRTWTSSRTCSARSTAT